MKDWDVVIVGGGMVGASFALALRSTPLRVLLIESVPPDSASQPSFDERTTALGNGSRQIFETLGVWHAMSGDASPIRSIHVSDAGRFGVARLQAGAGIVADSDPAAEHQECLNKLAALEAAIDLAEEGA